MQERDVIEECADGRPRRRREYSLAYKRKLVGMAMEPGASVSQIAQRHGLNTNLLFTWRRQKEYAPTMQPMMAPKLLPVAIAAPEPARRPGEEYAKGASYIEVEIGAARLWLHGAVDMETLSGVVRLLRGAR